MSSELDKLLQEQPHILQAAKDAFEAEKRLKEAFGGYDQATLARLLKEIEEREKAEKLLNPSVGNASESGPPPDFVSAMQRASEEKKAELQAFIRQEVKAEVARQLKQLQPRKSGSAPLE